MSISIVDLDRVLNQFSMSLWGTFGELTFWSFVVNMCLLSPSRSPKGGRRKGSQWKKSFSPIRPPKWKYYLMEFSRSQDQLYWNYLTGLTFWSFVVNMCLLSWRNWCFNWSRGCLKNLMFCVMLIFSFGWIVSRVTVITIRVAPIVVNLVWFHRKIVNITWKKKRSKKLYQKKTTYGLTNIVKAHADWW
jgi:hypothetical protein